MPSAVCQRHGDELDRAELVSTMERLLACLALCTSLSASAQVVYPYNPDANGDSQITSGDLLDFLPVFATSFTPQVITIDGVPLDEWLDDLEAEVNSNAAAIESLFAMQSQINSLEADNSDLQDQINSLQNQLDNLSFNVDGLPPCVDLDSDDICDFADACVGFAVEFTFEGGQSASCLLAGGEFPFADLWVADLQGAYLSGIDLSFAGLYAADLSFADLSFADLSFAYCGDVNFSHANLSNADLGNTHLYDAILISTDLAGADLSDSYMEGANLTGANLTGANLTGASLLYSSLYDADLTNATMICLHNCPDNLPSGYVCEPDSDCATPNRYRIVFQ